MQVIGICSNRPRPSLQNNHSKGSQHWRRDVWHAKDEHNNRTLCGINSDAFLIIGEIETDNNFCSRCAKRLGG